MFTDGRAIRKIVRAKGVPPLKPRRDPARPAVSLLRVVRGSAVKKNSPKNKDKVVAFRLSSEDFIQFE